MGIAMKTLSYPAMYTKSICLIMCDKSKRMNGLRMHLAFQTASRTSDYHFLLDLYSI